MINRFAAVVLAAALTWIVPGARQGAPSLVQTDVFVGGDRGYHTFRIPSIIATPTGTLVAFAEGRHDAAADSGHIDLVARRSTDAGATWSPLQVVGDNGADAWVNPCAVVDRKTGTLWLLSTQNRAADKEKEITAGSSRAGITVWALKSTDDGVTWSAPIEITASVKRPEWTWYATGPGVGIQTRSGRLVIPANHADAAGVHRSHLFYSDDGGSSWALGAIAAPGTNESQIVELADGRLMHNMRNHPPKTPANFRIVGISADGGRSYAGPLVEDRALIEPPAQASIFRYSTSETGGRHRLLFSNPASARRERMTVRVSYDEGQTWAASRVVHEGHAAYSSLVVLPDGRIGLLYERGEKSAYERLTFATFPLDWLESGRDGADRR
ncbi:MAG: sialidase family protein [Vicinamibacterales bacterium]